MASVRGTRGTERRIGFFFRLEQHFCAGKWFESLLKLPTDITHRFEKPAGTQLDR